MTDDVLEFWPDYGNRGPLWSRDGVDATAAVGLPGELVRALRLWNSEYAEDKLPLEEGTTGDIAWLERGRSLLSAVRDALPNREVIVTEPWWGVPDVDPNEHR